MKSEREQAQKSVAENRKAFHDYHILETFEAGVATAGHGGQGDPRGERQPARQLRARGRRRGVDLQRAHQSLQPSRYADHAPTRKRKLLLHRQEIRKLIGRTVERGMTLVPTRMYFKNGHVKVALGLAKGKQAHDKRETIKRREADRETRAAVKERRR